MHMKQFETRVNVVGTCRLVRFLGSIWFYGVFGGTARRCEMTAKYAVPITNPPGGGLIQSAGQIVIFILMSRPSKRRITIALWGIPEKSGMGRAVITQTQCKEHQNLRFADHENGYYLYLVLHMQGRGNTYITRFVPCLTS